MHQASLAHEAFKLLCHSVDSQYSNDSTRHLAMPKPSEYFSAIAFAKDYAVYTYLRKFKGDKEEVDRLTSEAILGFKETETFVRSTNERLKSSLSGYAGAERLLSDVRTQISRILGSFNLEDFAECCEWGPGATSSLKGKDSRVDKKILEPSISITPASLPYLCAYLKYDTGWFAARCGVMPEGPYSPLRNNFNVVSCSRLTTVEKTIRERRVIDIQPTGNLFLQKGVGELIRRRLKRDGINLDSQKTNQILAQLALRLGLATIDLSKASDTVSFEVVRQLLPADWFEVLDDLRTQATVLPDGSTWHLAKFSAMGNGYTFELESLIFHALCIVVKRYSGESHIPHGVYGDDIVISKTVVKCLFSCFRLLGFIPNAEKSWSTTLFRESCGKHFFNGRDVTPLYQKEEITTPLKLTAAANRLIRWNFRVSDGVLDSSLLLPYLALRDTFGYWVRFHAPYVKRSRKVYSKFCPLQPFGAEGDGALIDPTFNASQRSSILKSDYMVELQVGEKADDFALYALSLRRSSKRNALDFARYGDLAHLHITREGYVDDVVDCGMPFYGFATRKGGRTDVHFKSRKWLGMGGRFPQIV